MGLGKGTHVVKDLQAGMKIKNIKEIVSYQNFIICAVTILSILLRVVGMDFISNDMKTFLIPWYEQVEQLGKIRALSSQVGDYNVAYQFLIACFTYLPIKNVYSYKLLSCTFDYAIAIISYKIAKQFLDKNKALLVYMLVIVSPTIFFNSAFWGQCDSIYAFWCILSFYYLMKNNAKYSLFFWGIALSFKLQAIFFFPFLFVALFILDKNKITNLFMSVIGFFIPCMPALLSSRRLVEVFSIYYAQSKLVRSLYINYPSFWTLLTTDDMAFFSELKNILILFTVCVLGIITYICIIKKITLTHRNMLYLAILIVYSCVFFLPEMHERYNYLSVILSIILLLVDNKTLLGALLLLATECATYGRYLFGNSVSTLPLAWLNLIAYCVYWLCFAVNNNLINFDFTAETKD